MTFQDWRQLTQIVSRQIQDVPLPDSFQRTVIGFIVELLLTEPYDPAWQKDERQAAFRKRFQLDVAAWIMSWNDDTATDADNLLTKFYNLKNLLVDWRWMPSDPATADIVALALDAYRAGGPLPESIDDDTRMHWSDSLDRAMVGLMRRAGRAGLAGCFQYARTARLDRDGEGLGSSISSLQVRHLIAEDARDLDREFGPRWREKAEAGLCADTVR